MSQLQVTGEAKIRDIQGPVVSNSGVITALDGDASQYVRGDGTLADFPTSTGGGSSVSYYLNTSVSQGTIGGVAYKQLGKTPISGAGTDIAISTTGYVASYLTDANDPALLEVPAGNFNCEFYFSVNNNTGNPFVYAEVYKYDGTTFTLLGTSVGVPEYITEGTVINPYYFAVPVAVAALTVTDRIAIRIYVNVDGRTVTLHTENNHLCQVVTTFSKGLISLNNLTRQNQFFGIGTSGTDFAISSSVATHTFNLPVASAVNTGKLSSSDWSVFNNKLSTATAASTYVPYTGANANVDLAGFSLYLNNSQAIFGRNSTGITAYALIGVNPSNKVSIDTSALGVVFGGTIGNGTYTYTLPSATGTLALTSDISYPVTSVFGRTGAVVATEGDYSLTQLSDVTITTPSSGQVLKYNGTAWINDTDANTGTVTSVGLSSATSGVTIGSSPITTSGTITLAIATASGSLNGLLSSTDWTTFNNKQNALTNPVTGTGNSGYISLFTGTSAIGNSVIVQSGTNVGIMNASPTTTLDVTGGGKFSASITALSFIKSGGTSSQFLKADGTVDSSTYALDSLVVHLAGTETITGVKTFTGGSLYINSGTTSTAGTLYLGDGAITKAPGSGFTLSSLNITGNATFNSFIDVVAGSVTTPQIKGSGGATGIYWPNGSSGTAIGFAFASARMFESVGIASGVNYLRVTQSITGTSPSLSAQGTDVNINLTLTPKGSGSVIISSTISNGTYTYTLPSATGTLALTSNLSSYLPLAGGTLTGALSGTSATFSSTLGVTGVATFTSNIGWGGVTPTGSGGTSNTLESINGAQIAARIVVPQLYISSNVSGSPFAPTRAVTGYAAQINLDAFGGTISLNRAVSGSAGSAITWINNLGFDNTGAATFSSSIAATSATFSNLVTIAAFTTSDLSTSPQLSLTRTAGQFTGIAIRGSVAADRALFSVPNDDALYIGRHPGGGGAWTKQIAFLDNGNVGIGTSSPIAITNYTTLDIRGVNGSVIYLGQTSTPSLRFFGEGVDAYIDNSSTGALIFRTTSSGTERMRITSGGNVGIGTSSPSSLLTVAGATDLAWSAGTSKLQILRSGSQARINNYESGSGSSIAIAWDGGNALIGTTTDNGCKLQVNGVTQTNGLAFNNTYFSSSTTMTDAFFWWRFAGGIGQTLTLYSSTTNNMHFIKNESSIPLTITAQSGGAIMGLSSGTPSTSITLLAFKTVQIIASSSNGWYIMYQTT